MHVIRRASEPGRRASMDGKTPAVPPKITEIQPGTLFDVPADELEALERAGAVVKADDKRAAKFGFGSEAGKTAVAQEEGETADSAARRRRQAATTAKATGEGFRRAAGSGRRTAAVGGKKDELVG